MARAFLAPVPKIQSNYRLTDEVREEIKAIAEEQGVSEADAISSAIMAYRGLMHRQTKPPAQPASEVIHDRSGNPIRMGGDFARTPLLKSKGKIL